MLDQGGQNIKLPVRELINGTGFHNFSRFLGGDSSNCWNDSQKRNKSDGPHSMK